MSWYSLVHHTWLNVCGLCALTGCHWWVLNRTTMSLVFCEGKLITESTIAPCGLSCLLLSVGEPQPHMKCIAKGCASRGQISMNTKLCRLQVAWAEHLSMVSELELNVTPASTIYRAEINASVTALDFFPVSLWLLRLPLASEQDNGKHLCILYRRLVIEKQFF